MLPGTVLAFAESATSALIRIVATAGVAGIAIWLAGGLIGRTVARIVRRSGIEGEANRRADTRGETITQVLGAIARVVIGGLALLLILGDLGFELAPLIAGAGILGLAIGFGAQGLVSDVVSGLFMLVEDQYGVGDWIDAGEASGVVESMGLRTTRIRSLDGLLWTVRNGEITRTANANQGWGRAVVDVGVGYDADLRSTQAVIKAVADECAQDPEQAGKFLGEPEIWGIQELGDDAVTIRLACKTQPGLQWGVARELRLRVKEALDAAGVEIPFPQRTIWLRTEEGKLPEPLPVSVGGDGNGP